MSSVGLFEERKEKRRNRKEKNDLNKYNSVEIEENIFRCNTCGYIYAKELPFLSKKEAEEYNIEELQHVVHHDFFIGTKKRVKEVLTYEDLMSLIGTWDKTREKLKEEKDGPYFDMYTEVFLDLTYTIELNKSYLFHGYRKQHPSLNDYICLLWNTPLFIEYIKEYIPDDVTTSNIKRYNSNRMLYGSKEVLSDGFIYLSVTEKPFVENYIDLSSLDRSFRECS